MSIKIVNLNVSIDEKNIIKPLSISFEDNKNYVILGPNGAGKTTLLLSILNLLGRKIPENRVFVDDKKIEHYSRKQLARKISFIPQRKIFGASLSVRKIIEMGFFPYSSFISTYVDNEGFDQAVNSVGVANMLNRNILTLSAGEVQKVMIARAVYQNTKYMLVDEPEENLDLKNRSELIRLFNSFKGSKTVVMACHDINFALSIADVIVLLKEGQLIDVITERKLLTQKKLETLYDVGLNRVRLSDQDYFLLRS